MPRGNAVGENVVELQNQYGSFENADELIRAHRASIDPAVTRAGILPVNEEATAEWRKERRDEAAEKLGVAKDELLLDVAQRGNALVGVIQTADGDFRKAVAGANELYVAPVLSPEEEDDRERVKRDQEVAAEIAALRAQHAQDLDAVRRELAAEQSKELQKLREELGLVQQPSVAEEQSEEPKEKAKPKRGGRKLTGEAKTEDKGEDGEEPSKELESE